MFAPPASHLGSRRASATEPHHPHHPQYSAYDSSHSPMMPNPHLQRSNSFSWNPDLGMPPPPSEIDALGDSLNHALVPLSRPASRSQSISPTSRIPSHHGAEVEGLEESTERRDRTQDHMNMVTKHPKVKIDVILSSNVFEAGGAITGKVELTCTTGQRLRLGHIAVELEAVEQLTSRDHAATQLFLYNRTLFQGEKLPPSNAVLPAAPVNGYWTARKGRTSFPFSFRLPSSAPSCVKFAGNASLRYGLKATVQTWYNEDKMVVTARREAFVLEKWADQLHPRFREPAEAVADTRLFMGGNGAVWLEAGVSEQLFWGGGQMLIRCGIKNSTKRHLSGIKVSLARRLIFPVGSAEGFHDSPDKLSLEPRITEIVHERTFKGREYEFDPNAESVCTVAVDVPKDLRTIRKTRLFEVRIFAFVSLLLGSFAKDLTIEIPVYVAHTASGQPPAQQGLDSLHAGPPSHSVPQRPSSSMGHGHVAPLQQHQHHQHNQHHGQHAHPSHHGNQRQGLATNMAVGMVEVQRLAAERGWSPAPVLPGSGHLSDAARPASTAPGMIQLPSQAQPFMMSPDGHLQWNPAESSWNASRLVSPPAATGHSIQRSVSAAPDVVQNVAPPQPFAAIMDPTAQWAASQRAMSASPGPIAFTPHDNFVPAAAAPPQTHGVPFPQGPPAPSNDRRASLPAAGPYGGALPQQAAYQHAPQEVLPPMPEPQSITYSSRNAQQYSAPPLQPPMPPFAGGGGAPSITGLATIEEDSESQAGTIKTLAKLPTIGKTGKGGKGNSVSRNNIEQFEAMAEAEEDEEEVKRQMIAMGMQPDEDAFASKEQDRSSDARAEASDSTPKASTSRRADGTQASSSGTYRLKASDIFQHAGSADVPSSQAAEPARDLAEPTTAELGHSHDSYDSMQSNQARERRSSTASSVVSLRRSSSSQGIGLQALESNLVRTTTPKICTNSRPLVTMANVARAESVPSPLAAAPAVFDDSTRSRKNSALRAAALAREEAERKSAEEQARAAEERARQVQAEQARQAAAAEEEAARKQAARIRAEEQQRLERERIAEHARRQRELREQEEEQRLKAEAERVAREEEAKRQEREEMERQERQAAEAARARAVADDTKELRRLAYSASDRMERIKAAIANAPKSVAPSVPSKMTAPVLAAPSRTSDQDRVVLKQQAVQRVDGWLSNPTSPNTSHMNTPGTPSASVLSVMRKEEPSASAAGAGEGRSSYAYSSPSQVIDPMWEAKPPRSEKVEVAMPKSHTMADLASSKASAAVAPARNSIDEPIPQLSAELRALVDGSDIRPARKSGTALKEHPISRRLSGLGSTNKASAVVVPGPSFTHVSSQASRERHTSMPSWPRPGLPAGSNASAVPFVTATPSESSSSRGTERRASRNHETLEVGIPTRVEKTLMAPNFDSQRNKDEHSYDIRSARGGRGGRVTSVAQLWSKIAGDDDDAASDVSRNSLAAPSADGEPRSASPSNTSTFRPKPRRSSSASNSAPALDFSKKAMSSPTTSTGVTAIAATFAGEVDSNKPESLKSFTAPQFLNTSVPKAVFSASTDAASKPEKRPLPKPVLQPGAVPAPQLVRPTAMRAQKPERTSSRRISTQLLSTFEKDKVAQREMSVEEMMSKVSVDSTILGALNYDGSHDVSTWRCNNGTEIKMSGRGTTKAIGENKLKSLRAVWGS
ncbi:Immunoglobulin E-set [Kalmanozyma brasiliensis GHG001]|uniref:Immunoglobulin E-set n=1 Tax=Kalmanozyma brasiliensis (strain GHG001) TaxID=1365824 RepID=UPI002868143B|nr:Immunoglobulin E-set [Kalmanozyma brasiliensis GHG001]EST05242.2 Immunoglobulin E-set [Kalmanozyma brasiliensis GHG001]